MVVISRSQSEGSASRTGPGTLGQFLTGLAEPVGNKSAEYRVATGLFLLGKAGNPQHTVLRSKTGRVTELEIELDVLPKELVLHSNINWSDVHGFLIVLENRYRGYTRVSAEELEVEPAVQSTAMFFGTSNAMQSKFDAQLQKHVAQEVEDERQKMTAIEMARPKPPVPRREEHPALDPKIEHYLEALRHISEQDGGIPIPHHKH